jgi:AcrR family transcriptional regulator
MNDASEIAKPHAQGRERPKSSGGRPTRTAAAARDERLLEIATNMFLQYGFEATSIDSLAEAAGIGKATLYARYSDKSALFTAVLRRRILQVYLPIEAELENNFKGADLEDALQLIAQRLLEKSVTTESITLGRILSAQASRFPDLAQLAVQESWGRQLRLVEGVLRHFSGEICLPPLDFPLIADLFLSIVLGRVTALAMFGSVPDRDALVKRSKAAVRLFVRGLKGDPA